MRIFKSSDQLAHTIIAVTPAHPIHILYGVGGPVPQLIHSDQVRVPTSFINPCTPKHNRAIINTPRIQN